MLPDDATVAEEHLLTFSTRCPDVRTLHFCVDRCATAPRATRAPRRRLETSPVGRQVSSRLRSGSAFTFYGPAGAAYDPQKSHKVVKFGGPHAKVSTLSPGPAKYDPSQIALHQVSTQRRAPSSPSSAARAPGTRSRSGASTGIGHDSKIYLRPATCTRWPSRPRFYKTVPALPFRAAVDAPTPSHPWRTRRGSWARSRSSAAALAPGPRVRKARAAAGLEAP